MILRDVEVDGVRVDVRVSDGTVAAVGRLAREPGEEVVEGRGGVLLPGLWDHHVHLLALAAARRSVPAGPPEVGDAESLASALRSAPGDGWIRAVGYHESVVGDLDRGVLDRLSPDRPVRVQHRSGALWVLNTPALAAVGSDSADGRLFGADKWLRERLPPTPPPDLEGVAVELAGYGVVGVTDATPFDDVEDLRALADLPLQVRATGGPAIASATFPAGVDRGPVKVVVAEYRLPSLDELVAAVALAHAAGRPAAVHCVTRSALALTLAAFEDTGAIPGDRIEHGSVVPPDLAAVVAGLRLTVVTNPVFVADRGDDYLRDVERDDRAHLYPCASLLAIGIETAAGTDAPYGDADPWRSVAAAIDRRTRSGVVLGPDERVAPSTALALFLGHPDRPGGPVRRVVAGAAADLCLLDGPLRVVLAEPDAERVRRTWVGGEPLGAG